MKTNITFIAAIIATTLLSSCAGGGSGGVNANVGGLAKVSAGGSGHSHARRH